MTVPTSTLKLSEVFFKLRMNYINLFCCYNSLIHVHGIYKTNYTISRCPISNLLDCCLIIRIKLGIKYDLTAIQWMLVYMLPKLCL